MSPLPNHRIIPRGFSAHLAPVMNRTMTSLCNVLSTHHGPDPWPLPEGWTGHDPVVQGVPCRVVELNSPSVLVQAEQPLNTRSYQVTLPLGRVPQLRPGQDGHTLQMIAATDEGLVGRLLRITDVQYGSEQFQRVLQCEDDMTQNGPYQVREATLMDLQAAYTGATLGDFDRAWTGYALEEILLTPPEGTP